MSVLTQDAARAVVDRIAHGAPVYFVAVAAHDGSTDPAEQNGPFVFEHYLRTDCTREAAASRVECAGMRKCGGGRLARLDFDLGGDPSEPHIVVAGHDGVSRDRGPLVWETYLPGHDRARAERAAAGIAPRYGGARIARVVFEDVDGRPL
jgi:hypothetical protein